MNNELENALRVARMLMNIGQSLEQAIGNSAIPLELKDEVRGVLQKEETIILTDARVITARSREQTMWLNEQDRSEWYYWPRLRAFLIDIKGWSEPVVRSIDNATDRILSQLRPPTDSQFDTRGLVLGFVQSGKTANFSALIAKSVDVGYRLVIVLSGVHNTLRRQTQRRLMKELVGYSTRQPGAVALPPQGRWWLTLTKEDIDGDFEPGTMNYGPLQGTQPVLMVVKKNGPVLRKLLTWLDSAPPGTRATLPLIVIDDEADQASVNTGGDRPSDDDEEPDPQADTTPPSVINALIRGLLRRFDRSAYVGYTATPFANVLIQHDASDREAGEDLYPRDFFVDLPKPPGYFGAEEIFGSFNAEDGQEQDGLNILRIISKSEVEALVPSRGVNVVTFQLALPPSLENAIIDFILAGAARRQRGDGQEPASMLVHTHLRTIIQEKLSELVGARLAELRDEWRYQRDYGIRERLETRWINEFRPLIRSLHAERAISFDHLVEHIGPFFEEIVVKQINSATEDDLDYERDPELKVIVIGGNRLSRGLTLEGLLISYYLRPSTMYDTLMQMGRWFGFREGYEDLTRIYTTTDLVKCFRELAAVESELRADIRVYESAGLTPRELGPRIRTTPGMLVTSRLKMRNASNLVIEQRYDGHFLQVTEYPLDERAFLEHNIKVTKDFISHLGSPTESPAPSQPFWQEIPWQEILTFLSEYQVGQAAQEGAFPASLIRRYIERMVEKRELSEWTVAIRGLQKYDRTLKSIDLGLVTGELINCITRNRLKDTAGALKTITSRGDEETGLTAEQLQQARELQQREQIGEGNALRAVRSPTNGLLLIYPISRYSRLSAGQEKTRVSLFDDPEKGTDVIGLAISFPTSEAAVTISGTYVMGTVPWRPL